MKLEFNLRLRGIQKEFRKSIHIATKLLVESIRASKMLFMVYVLITTLSVAVYCVSLNFGGVIYCLSASTSTPWGVATSIFVHGGGIGHLVNNVIALFTLFAIFSITNYSSETNKRIKIKFFVALIIGAAVVSNLFWIILAPQSSTSGLSGVVYAAEGVVLAVSLSNTLSLFRLKKLTAEEERRTYLRWLMNFLIFSIIMASIASNPGIFLSAAPRVNVFVHGISFLVSFYSSLGLAFPIAHPTKPALLKPS